MFSKKITTSAKRILTAVMVLVLAVAFPVGIYLSALNYSTSIVIAAGNDTAAKSHVIMEVNMGNHEFDNEYRKIVAEKHLRNILDSNQETRIAQGCP